MIGRSEVLLRWGVVALLLAFVAVGCKELEVNRVPPDERAFLRAERMNTRSAYIMFANSYPKSSLAAEAKKRVAGLVEAEALRLFEGVKDSNKASILERFIAEHPGTKAATLAKLRIAEIDFSELVTESEFRRFSPSNMTWKGFVGWYAFGDYLPMPEDAQLRETYYKKLHPLLILGLTKVGSFERWVAYLTTYDKSPYFQEAAEKAEQLLMARAGEWETYGLMRAYVALYGGAVFKRDCVNRESLERAFENGLAETVQEVDTEDQYNNYLKEFPDSPHSKKITVRKAHLEFEKAFTKTSLANRKAVERLVATYENNPDPLAKEDVKQGRIYLATLELNDAVSSNTPQTLRDFIAGKSPHISITGIATLVGNAQDRLDRMHRTQLARARKGNRTAGYRQFLLDFPESTDREEVTDLWIAAQFNEAIRATSRTLLADLVTTYSNVQFARKADLLREAKVSIDKIDYGDALRDAGKGPSTGPLQTYIEDHPKGAHVSNARAEMQTINEHFREYVDKYRRAQQMGRRGVEDFSRWLTSDTGNMYAKARGRVDLVQLRRTTNLRDIRDSLTAPSQGDLPRPMGRLVFQRKWGPSVALVTSGNSGTGFVFTDDGLLLTYGWLVRFGKKTRSGRPRISVKVGRTGRLAEVVAEAGLTSPDLAVLSVDGNFTPISLKNHDVLEDGGLVYCLSAVSKGQDQYVVEFKTGTFVKAQTVGGNDWLIIASTEIHSDLGGVIFSPRGGWAVAIVMPIERLGDEVKKAIASDGQDNRVYALSLRAALPIIEKSIRAQGGGGWQ